MKHEVDVSAADIARQRSHLRQVLATMIRETDSHPADPGFLTILQKLDALERLVPTRPDSQADQPIDVGWDERTGERVTLPPRRRKSEPSA